MNQPINSLTGLRFVAAFVIVLHHFGKPPLPQFAEFVRNVLAHGFVAVTLFFILSGFILTYSYVGHEGNLNTSKRIFRVARFARRWPAHRFLKKAFSSGKGADQKLMGAVS